MGVRSNVFDCHVYKLPKTSFREGNITVIENSINIPFEVSRVFYLYDIPGGESRGAHAHKECHQFLIAASGAFEIHLDDGKTQKTIQLNQPYMGLHIPPGIWAAEINFSSGVICLVLASHNYNEEDYIRDYRNFVKYKENG
ncbi:MAG TPA: FdtA/QdtA family cupin domain-containing protein [Cytophagaceae bacterium]